MEFKQIQVSILLRHNWFGQIPPVTSVPHLKDRVTRLAGTEQHRAWHTALRRLQHHQMTNAKIRLGGAQPHHVGLSMLRETAAGTLIQTSIYRAAKTLCGKVYFVFHQHYLYLYTLCSIRKLFVFFKLPDTLPSFYSGSGSLTVYRVIIQQIFSEYLAGTVPGHSGRRNMGDRAPRRQVLQTSSVGLWTQVLVHFP